MGQLPSTNAVWGSYLHGRNFSRHVIPNSCPDCYTVRGCGCPCCNNYNRSATYLCDFGANIAIPTGGTVEPISLALTIDGATIPASTMIATPAAVEEYFNVSRAINADVWNGCCETVSVRNTSTQPILVQNANIIFSRPDLLVSR